MFFLLGDSQGVWILCADILEHSDSSIFISSVSRKNNRDEIVGVFTREKVWLKIVWANTSFRMSQAILSQTAGKY